MEGSKFQVFQGPSTRATIALYRFIRYSSRHEAWNQAIYRGSWFEMTGPYLGPLVPQMVTMAAGDEANLRAQGLGLFLLF